MRALVDLPLPPSSSNCAVVPLSIYYQNTRGLRTKTDLLYRASLCSDYHIVALTETWANSSINDSELLADKYVVYRKDRNFTTTGTSRGGGVLIAVHNASPSSVVNVDSMHNIISPLIDVIIVKLNINFSTLYVIAVYIPPSIITSELVTLFDFLSTLNFLESNYLIIGDFNITNYASHFDHSKTDANSITLYNFISISGMMQLNFIRNKDNRILDLALSNQECSVNKCEEPFVPEDNYHPALDISISFKCRPKKPKDTLSSGCTPQYNFLQANFLTLYDSLLHIDWTPLDSFSDPNEACDYFYSILYTTLDLHVPKTTRRHSDKYPPWFSNAIIRDIKRKESFRRL